jgi:tetratricopeptide (TPR) repeat protein
MLLGFVYLWQKQPEQAIAEGERALALDPNNADAYSRLGEILNLAGRPEEAIDLAQQAMRLNPQYPGVYPHRLGVAYYLTGQYAEAIAALQDTLRRNPSFLTAYSFLAWSYVDQWAGQWSEDPQTLERAVEAAQQAVALSDAIFYLHGTLSRVYLWQKQHEEALAEAEQAVALNATDALSHTFLGNVLNFAGRSEEALERMEQVSCSTAFAPNPDFCFFVLGEAYALTGRYEEAIGACQQALTHKPDWSVRLLSHLRLAASYSELGREEEARAEIAEVLKLNPQFSLEGIRQRWPYKDPADLERYVSALRKAGLE